MAGFISVGYFLISLFFSLLIFIVWARLGLRYCRVSALHPINQAIHRFSDPLVSPFQSLLHTKGKRLSRYDWPCFTVLVIIEFAKFIAFGYLLLGTMMPVLLLCAYVVADLIVQPCDLLFYAILIRVIMSWVNPRWQHPIADILYLVTEPLLKRAKRLIPDIAGFDFSPILAMLFLKIITLFISSSLPLHLI